MAYVAVTKYGVETMFRNRPMKFRSFWVDYQEIGKISEVLNKDFDEDCSIELPSGTIEKYAWNVAQCEVGITEAGEDW